MDLGHLVYLQDEPFGSLSIYAQYCVMRLAQKKVKVVLDGQGADELLAGYLGYQGSYIRGLVQQFRWGTAIREIAGSLMRHRAFFASAREQLRVRRARRGLLKCTVAPVDRYGGTLDTVLHRELLSTNLPALLHYEDRNAMGFSLESRVPYLDVRLVEYIASLPLSQKIRGGCTKVALRAAIAGLVPESVRCRGDKMGFVTPEECWMEDELRPFMIDIFSSDSFKGRPYWDAVAVLQDYQAFLGGTSAYSPEIWRIACTEIWLRTFFDVPSGAVPVA
jgi:asparagine synthase (glutamine-hydrolysing)